ncbi:MAG: RNA polymerase sigma factor [Acidobacteriia bacterium]|nr:RNA polymerase sigma factor [Terriglobia bacterium]
MTDADFRDALHGHKDVVHRFAYRMTGSSSAAEDIVQDCFLILWRKPGAYDPIRGAMRAFLLGIARNLVLKRWRDERPHEALEDDAFVFQPLNVREDGRAEAVEKAILMLPPLQREAVVLAEYEEMSLDEIAQATAADLAAVKSRLHRARQNLRRMLAPILESKGAFHGTK